MNLIQIRQLANISLDRISTSLSVCTGTSHRRVVNVASVTYSQLNDCVYINTLASNEWLMRF